MTFLERIKEFIAALGLLPLVKLLFSKPIYFFLNYRFKKSSNTAISLLHTAIKNSKTSPWLAFGTFLGAHRDKKIIAHDFDIDFAMLHSDDIFALEAELLKLGFKNIRTIHLKSSGQLLEKTYSYRGAHIDIFITYEEGDNFVTYDFSSLPEKTWGETINLLGGLRAHKNTFSKFNIQSMEFMNLPFNAPSEESADLHLKQLYGDTYMTPNANWHLDQREIRKLIDDIGLIS